LDLQKAILKIFRPYVTLVRLPNALPLTGDLIPLLEVLQRQVVLDLYGLPFFHPVGAENKPIIKPLLSLRVTALGSSFVPLFTRLRK